MDVSLFPFNEYWWAYAGFLLFVLAMLGLDLGVFHRKAHAVSFRESAAWTAIWVSLALAFNVGLYAYAHATFPVDPRLLAIPGFDAAAAAERVGWEFLTGFVIEKALAVDNIFVFAIVFSYFNIPAAYQHRVLFFGILGALFFRAIFIALGAVLLQYHWVVVVAGVFLVLTGLKLMIGPEKPIEPEKNPVIKLVRRFLPITNTLENDHFFVRKNGVLFGTPLFITLLVLEFSDIIFAIDSVPAIFAITKEPLIVFTSNIFAILGLRSLYFMLANVIDRFYMLKYGLALVLVFVGLKMAWLNEAFGGKFPIGVSLGIIAGILAVSIVASWLLPPKRPEKVDRAAK
ncbi:MAG: TerC family protein [Pseudomonadota bacterium]|nr:TerC family protein [Pseudomonadota bacterium]